MTDRPILFSAPMINALRAGAKTQTRRVMTRKNTLFNGAAWTALQKRQDFAWDRAWVDPGPSPAGNAGPYLKLPWLDAADPEDRATFEGTVHRIYSRIQPGDRLWVREAWHSVIGYDDRPPRDIPEGTPIHYCADAELDHGWQWGRGRPGMFMPHWASRLTLAVTDVRVQRVQDISEEDAEAEGVELWGDATWKDYSANGLTHVVLNPRDSFRTLWNSINGPDAWHSNPWVAAISFTVEHHHD